MHQLIHLSVWFMVGIKTRKWATHICHQMQNQYWNLQFSWTSEEVACPIGMVDQKIDSALQQTRALPSAIALGKAFAECCTRQRVVGISLHGKGFFAECRMSGTRQRISRVSRRLSAKKSRRDGQVTVTCFAECLHLALGKACFLFFLDFLCRVL